MERNDSMNKVREIQLGELTLLESYIDLCKRHNLRYYALSICEQELPESVILRLHDDNLGNTSIMDTSIQIQFGNEWCSPFIDIFPLDGYPEDGIHYWLHTNKIKFYRALSKISVIDRIHERDRGSFENAIVKVSKALKLNKLLNTSKINKKLQSIIKQYDYETSSMVGNVLGSYRERELARKEVFGEPQLLEFEAVEKFVLEQRPLHLMGVNADKINQCQTDESIKKIVNDSEIINADGASVVLASRFLGYQVPERVAGIDLMQKLLHLANEKSYSVYFFGAKEEVLIDMLEIFKKDYPNLRVLGYRNGYFSEEDEYGIQEDIRAKNPDFVFVGITSPKKEYIIQKFMDQGVNSVFMGVGGSFDVLSGHIQRAPLWMQKSNLEWLFRVVNEPKRLFKRYFVGNATFIKRVLDEKRKSKK